MPRPLVPLVALCVVVVAFAAIRIRAWLRIRRALAALRNGDPLQYRARLRLLGRSIGAPPSRWRRFYDAVGLFWQGRFDASYAALTSLESDGFGPLLGGRLRAMSAASLLMMDRTKQATDLLEACSSSIRSVNGPPGVPLLSTLQGIAAFERSDLTVARRALEGSDETEPTARLVHFYRAAIARREGREEEARSHLVAASHDAGSLFVARWAESAQTEYFSDGPAPVSPATLTGPTATGARAWLRNLRAGPSILICRASAARNLVVDLEQTTWLMLTNLACIFLFHLATRPRDGIFLAEEALAACAPILLVVAVAVVTARIVGQKEIGLRLACGFFAALPWLLGVRVLAEHHIHFKGDRVLNIALGFWAFAIFLCLVLAVARRSSFVRVLAAGPCFVALWLLPMWQTRLMPMWVSPYPETTGRNEEISHEAVAERFFEQSELLHSAENRLEPERPGVDDLYFVGFAAYGDQDVFYRETRAAQALLDWHFDTEGRSLIFSNDESSRTSIPAASPLNLKHALAFVGTKMNRSEDILFLYLTSHGSDRGLAVVTSDAPELVGGGELTPTELRAMLDRSGIVSRVILVAGCESGVFVDALKNDDTVVATSSAVDRVSYGCAIGRDFTEFGRAVFGEQLMRQRSIVPALQAAIESIRNREVDAGRKESNPQLWVGPKIAPKLDALAQRLSK